MKGTTKDVVLKTTHASFFFQSVGHSLIKQPKMSSLALHHVSNNPLAPSAPPHTPDEHTFPPPRLHTHLLPIPNKISESRPRPKKKAFSIRSRGQRR